MLLVNGSYMYILLILKKSCTMYVLKDVFMNHELFFNPLLGKLNVGYGCSKFLSLDILCIR